MRMPEEWRTLSLYGRLYPVDRGVTKHTKSDLLMKGVRNHLAAIDQELEEARAGVCAWVSAKAAARFLGVHPDTLGDWRRRDPPHGPAWTKGIGGGSGRNQHVRYDYRSLVAWANDRFDQTTNGQRLLDQLHLVRAKQREVELELQLRRERIRLQRISKHRQR